MRIVFLANPIADYLQDTVFHGLATILGSDNVIEYPALPRYHSGATPGPGYPAYRLDFPEPPRPSFREAVAAADAVVIGSLREGVRGHVEELLSMRSTPPIALLDGEDDFYVRRIHSRVDVYCKRETLVSGWGPAAYMTLRRMYRRLRRRAPSDPLAQFVRPALARDRSLVPLPFAWTGPLRERRQIEYDVTFLSPPSIPERVLAHSGVEALRADGIRVRTLDAGERLDWNEYMDILASSRISVSVRGGGFDTYRYWEIPAAGAMLLAETPRIVIPGNFVDGLEAVFAPVEKLISRVPALLEGDTETIARNGREKLLAAHTSVHRAQTVLHAIEAIS